jgi:hypothetical protein
MLFQKKAILPVLVLVGALLGLSGAANAATFTLDQLVNGGSFVSDDGTLTFSDFKVTKTKRLSGNLADYTVTVLGDGFMLSSGEFTANTGGLRKFDLSYKVTANQGAITGASMDSVGSSTSGKVKIEKDIEDLLSDEGTFLLNLIRSGSSILSDSDSFSAPGVVSFDVEEQIRIKKVSSLTSVSNHYTVVPEPVELSLLAAGLAGLTWLGRRRSASRV